MGLDDRALGQPFAFLWVNVKMSRKCPCGSEIHCSRLRNQISWVLTSGNADQCRGSQISSERAAGDGDGGAIWLWGCHGGMSSLLSPMSAVITGVEGKQGQIQIQPLSGYFCFFCQVEVSSKSGEPWHLMQITPLDLMFLCESTLFSPSLLLPHPLIPSFLPHLFIPSPQSIQVTVKTEVAWEGWKRYRLGREPLCLVSASPLTGCVTLDKLFFS